MCMLHQLAIDKQRLFGDLLHGELSTPAGVPPWKALPLLWIVEQALQSLPQPDDVIFGKNQAGIADHLGNLAAVAADHGDAAGHGFHKHAAKLLLPIGLCAVGNTSTSSSW